MALPVAVIDGLYNDMSGVAGATISAARLVLLLTLGDVIADRRCIWRYHHGFTAPSLSLAWLSHVSAITGSVILFWLNL